MQEASIPCALVARSSSIKRAAKATAGVLILISSCAVLLCCADPNKSIEESDAVVCPAAECEVARSSSRMEWEQAARLRRSDLRRLYIYTPAVVSPSLAHCSDGALTCQTLPN